MAGFEDDVVACVHTRLAKSHDADAVKDWAQKKNES
jgi:hypothetical protein